MIGVMDMAELASRFGWSLHGQSNTFTRICSDSRQLQAGDFFVALLGENFDGHEFVRQAAGAGAIGALVEQRVASELPQLICLNTLQGMAALASLNRERFAGALVALTGSVGKTSTKEMLVAILRQQGQVHATRGNLNNEIGVPRSLLELTAESDFAVIEMGAAKRGDIRYLTDIVRPDIALLTTAKEAHLAGFGSLQVVAETKGEIFTGLDAGKIAVINADDPFCELWRSMAAPARVITFGVDNPVADVSAQSLQLHAQSSQFSLHIAEKSVACHLPVSGKHMVANAVAASACAHALGLPIEKIAAGLRQFEPVAGRLQALKSVFGGGLIDDSYNANPASMRAAIDVLVGQSGTKVLIMGDMGELGDQAVVLHRAMGEYARRLGVERLWATGRLSRVAVDSFGSAGKWFENRQQLLDYAHDNLTTEHVVLVKGSRSAAMDEVVAGLCATAVAGHE